MAAYNRCTNCGWNMTLSTRECPRCGMPVRMGARRSGGAGALILGLLILFLMCGGFIHLMEGNGRNRSADINAAANRPARSEVPRTQVADEEPDQKQILTKRAHKSAADAAAANTRLEEARARVCERLLLDAAYKLLVAKVDIDARALQEAREFGTDDAIRQASTKWLQSKNAVTEAENKACAEDPEVQTAEADSVTAATTAKADVKAIAEFQAAEQQRQQQEAQQASARQNQSDTVRNAGSGSGEKTVHVNGYTRKDGTYVRPHDRSAPSRSGRR